jgi:Rrf2 family protein
MSSNSKFAIAVHALSVLGYFGNNPVTSEIIAASVNTNPVVIRRIFGILKRAGLVESQPGNQGGLSLARSPDRITLADIYRALETERFIKIHGNPENKKCPVSRNIKPVLDHVLESTERLIDNSLEKTTLADLITQIRKEDMG